MKGSRSSVDMWWPVREKKPSLCLRAALFCLLKAKVGRVGELARFESVTSCKLNSFPLASASMLRLKPRPHTPLGPNGTDWTALTEAGLLLFFRNTFCIDSSRSRGHVYREAYVGLPIWLPRIKREMGGVRWQVKFLQLGRKCICICFASYSSCGTARLYYLIGLLSLSKIATLWKEIDFIDQNMSHRWRSVPFSVNLLHHIQLTNSDLLLTQHELWLFDCPKANSSECSHGFVKDSLFYAFPLCTDFL